MELRVWFDGIPRVVCGITKETTCRDVVIILARAARQTGRFTLIERWRNIERPLAPLENPLLILQKWGEHAGDVQLLLSRSDKKRLSGWTKGQQGLRECFVHSFSPPPPNHREFGIKRSLTFSGSRNCFSPPCKKKEVVRKKLQKELAPAGFESKTGSHSSMHLKDPALKKPVPVQRSTVLKPKVRQPGKAIGTVSPLQNSLSPFSGSSEKSHGLLPQQISNQSDSLASKQARSNQIYENISSIQSVYSIKESGVRDPGVHGPEAEFEEYDLDKNLPPSSGKLQQQDVIEDHEMEQDESSKEAMLNLVHLVSIQQARMKFQETQINDLDSEISLLEANNFELDDADLDAEEDFVQFQNLEQEYKEQLLQLDGDALNSELSSEKEHEVVLKSGVKDVQFQLSRCEHELSQMQEKICGLEQEVQQLVAEEVGRTKQVVTEQLLEYDRNKDSLEDLQQELEDLESTIEEKKSQVASLVSELKEANLGELQQQQPGKCADSGEVVLRLLEKHMLSSHHHGTHQKSSSFDGRLEAIGTSSTQCNDGVWV